MGDPRAERIVTLDLIRGIAVLGILVINVAGFAGPPVAVLSPNQPVPGTFADEAVFALSFVLFEGKMRALFALLFGASLTLFVDRIDARGGHGDALQLSRLGWLALFGLAHFYLLWWGDILFILSACGLLVLLARELPVKTQVIAALAIFTIWHASGAAMSAPDVATEEAVRRGTASAAQLSAYADFLKAVAAKAQDDVASALSGFAHLAAVRLGDDTLQPVFNLFSAMGEIVPLMLLGMAFYRSGFFTGNWPRKRILMVAWLGMGIGLGLTLTLLIWAWARGFPIRAMESIFLYWSAIPHLLMATGYAAVLVLLAPRVAETRLGHSLIATGRMAFSNYIATSVVMTAIFYGWGLGLIGRFGHAQLMLFVSAAWVAMLLWSEAWLSRFRRGPLEWLWRSLVQKRMLTNIS